MTKGFTPLFYFCIDPRTMAIRHGVKGPIKTPADLAGMKVRVPGSKGRDNARARTVEPGAVEQPTEKEGA